MKSFEIKELVVEYLSILKSFPRVKFVFKFLIIPSIISLLIAVTIDFDSSITDIFGVIISILIGLLFNFVSSFGSRVSSINLDQLAKEKLKRLVLVRETYVAAFISILISILTLILIFLIIICRDGNASNNNIIFNALFYLNKLFSFLLTFTVYHLFLLLILMINRLKKLMDTDVEEEKKFLEKERDKQINDWD